VVTILNSRKKTSFLEKLIIPFAILFVLVLFYLEFKDNHAPFKSILSYLFELTIGWIVFILPLIVVGILLTIAISYYWHNRKSLLVKESPNLLPAEKLEKALGDRFEEFKKNIDYMPMHQSKKYGALVYKQECQKILDKMNIKDIDLEEFTIKNY
jgi:predicted membrane protein